MSAKFWAPHSIKQSVQQPATPASMTRALRGTRKDVSNMTPVELATRMNNEAHLRARIRNAQGEPAIRPLSTELNPVAAPIIPTQLADNTRVNRRKV